MFDLRRLRLLHELSLRGTLAAVADALSYSPSTVSQQLALLEKEAGVALLEPDGRRVRLTSHGQALAAHAARALQADEQARTELASLGVEPTLVRVAAIQTVSQNLLPRVITLLAERAAHLRIEAAELAPETSLLELSAGAFDLVIAEQYPGHTRPRRDGVTHAILGQDWLRLVVPKDCPVDGLAELADQPWVLEPEGTAVRQWAVQQCRAAGFEPQIRFNAADLTTQVRLIAAGHAVGLLPDLVWAAGDPARKSVRQLPLPTNPSREILVAFRTAAAADGRLALVREALRDAFAERVGAGAGSLTTSPVPPG